MVILTLRVMVLPIVRVMVILTHRVILTLRVMVIPIVRVMVRVRVMIIPIVRVIVRVRDSVRAGVRGWNDVTKCFRP